MSARRTLALALLVAACNAPTGLATGVRLDMAQSVFARGAPIAFTVVNTSRQTVFVAACGDRMSVAIEHWEDAAWRQYSSGVCLAIYPMVPLPVSAGASREGSRVVRDAGRYRILLAVETQPNRITTVASHAFEVR